MNNPLELVDNKFLRQFELSQSNQMAKIEYSLQERKIFLTKLIVPEEIMSDNFVEQFIQLVMAEIAERNISVVPTSPPIAKFIRKNRRYKSMLPVGLRL
jgi:hypothetical protein